MSAGFGVDPARLRRHAGTVGALADRLGTLSRGLPENGPGDQALGAFVQFLTAGLQTATAKVTGAVAHASSTVDAVSANLRRTAEHYERQDEHNAAVLPREDLR